MIDDESYRMNSYFTIFILIFRRSLRLDSIMITKSTKSSITSIKLKIETPKNKPNVPTKLIQTNQIHSC
jgi:hypothetical protein